MAETSKNVILKETLDKIAAENQFEDYDVTIKEISSDGANYTSKLYLATISSDKRNLKLFAKVIIVSDQFRSQGAESLFVAEPFVYTKLSRMYRQLEEKYNVHKYNRLEFPKFYGYNPSRGQEILVLEDFVAQGYSDYDRFKSVDWPYASQAIKELAKFHALSFALEYEQPEEFKKASDTLKFNMDDNEVMQEMMSKCLDSALAVTEEKNQSKLKYFFVRNVKNFTTYTQALRRNVLMHGDFRMSNLMHKVDEDGTYHIKVLDYQTMCKGSPVADLLYFIFTGTDEEFRSKHYFPLLDHYYTQLSLAMCRLKLKPNEIYSRNDFDYELQQKLPYGLLIAVTILSVVMVDKEDAPKMDTDADVSSFAMIKTGKFYPKRLNGILNDFVKWGVL